ncbi:MAG TPA: sensor domain-containing diguanylate cyclase [Vitreimonas sp.]|nr:sensor domain-containing diguanylate cyclase [Vitreimonas sp.]
MRRALGRTPPAPQTERATLLAGRLDTVLIVARRLTRSLDSAEVFRTIVEETNRALGADCTTIRVLRDGQLELTAWAGVSDETAMRLPTIAANDVWFLDVLAARRPRAIEDVHADDRPGHERWTGDLAFAGELVVPLVHDDRVIGVLRAVSRAPRRWTRDELEFSSALAAHASIAIHNAELFERTESRAAQLAVLHAAAARINRARTVEAVGRAVVEETRRVLDYHNARVYLLEPPDQVVPIAFEGRVGEYDKVDMAVLQTTVGVGFTGWVAEHGVPLLIDDANADPRGQSIPGTDDIDESMLVVPMSVDGQVLGVITLSKLGLRQFGDEDLRLLATLAEQAATAVESARLVSRSLGVARELQLLVEMSGALSDSLDSRQVANRIAKHIGRALEVDECAISYWDRPGSRVLTLGYWPETRLDDLEPSFDISGFPETRRVLESQVTSVVDATDPDGDPAERSLLAREGNRSLAMLPLVAKGESIGLVELMSKSAVVWDDARLAMARTMANEASMALENARLYEEARTLADRDPLTGFYNHRYLHERLGEEIVRAHRSRRPLSLLMLDLDDFKLVNDTFGHLFGDRVLVWLAEQIRSTLRLSDVPARYGGDEFAVILPEADREAARSAAERIVATLRDHPFEAEGRGPLPIGASIGVASHPADGRTATELIAAADRGLYRIKRAGGQGVEPAGPKLAGDAVDAA